jgi:thiosulfate dehydrogenase
MLKKFLYIIGVIMLLGSGLYLIYTSNKKPINQSVQLNVSKTDTSAWVGASQFQIPLDTNQNGPLIRYGYELVAHTSKYLGPKGIVQHSTNGMNCQNCHLEAGTKPWGLNYGAVFSTYPKFRERSGSIETIYKRINDCMERSLNGKALDTNSKEIKAIYAYIKWLGEKVPKGKKVRGSGIELIPQLTVAANPKNGLYVYTQYCQKCHGNNGEGLMNKEGNSYEYPPLWGANSYNDAAGINQLSKLAGFIKNNMPNPVNYRKPTLTTEQAWDVAAYISSHSRPTKDKSKDWPVLATKPFDYPFGPYADTFSVTQHKYGPFEPIQLIKLSKK